MYNHEFITNPVWISKCVSLTFLYITLMRSDVVTSEMSVHEEVLQLFSGAYFQVFTEVLNEVFFGNLSWVSSFHKHGVESRLEFGSFNHTR